MINTLLVSIWAILVTLGIFYFQHTRSNNHDADKPPPLIFSDFETETLSVALYGTGKIDGHFVAKIHFQLPEKIQKELPMPIELIFGDQLFGIMNAMDIAEFIKPEKETIQATAQKLEDVLKSDELPIKNITFEEVDFLPSK